LHYDAVASKAASPITFHMKRDLIVGACSKWVVLWIYKNSLKMQTLYCKFDFVYSRIFKPWGKQGLFKFIFLSPKVLLFLYQV